SGFGKHRGVDAAEAVEALRPISDGALLHNCAPGPWLDLARRAGFDGVAVDSRLADLDELAQWADERRTLVLGVVDTSSARRQGVDELVREALRVLRTIQAEAGDHLVLGTACGMAGWRQDDVVPQLEALSRAASHVEEELARG
ncbi:uroporphyrinogen decarboxylase family protein, partial [Tessaracoccus lubricantis]